VGAIHQDDPIKHQHVYFAHVFKGQKGAEKVLKRYTDQIPAAAAAAAAAAPSACFWPVG